MNISNIISTMLTKLKTYTDNKVADIKKYPYNWNETNSSNKGYIKNKPIALPANGGNVTKVSGYSIWSGTQYAYDSIAKKDPNTLYFIKEGSTTSNGDLVILKNKAMLNEDIHGGIYYGINSYFDHTSSKGIYTTNTVGVNDYRGFTFANKIDFSKYTSIKITYYDSLGNNIRMRLFTSSTPFNGYYESAKANSGYTVTSTGAASESSPITKEFDISSWTGSHYFALETYNGSNTYITELVLSESPVGTGGETNNDLILFGNGHWQNTDISGGFTTNHSYVYISSNNIYLKNVRDLGLCTCSKSKINFSKYKKLSFTVRADTTCSFYVGSYNQSYESSQSSTFDPKTYNNRQKYNIDSSFTTYEIDISGWTTGYLMFLKTAQSLGPGVYISEIKLIGDSNGTGDKVLLSNTVNTLGSFRVVYEHALDNGTDPMYHGAAFMEGSNLVTRFGIGNNSSGTFEGYECSLATQNAINVSGYTKLQFTIVDGDYSTTTENAYLQVGLGSNPSTVNYYPTVFKTLTGKPETNIGIYTVDISSFTSSNSTAYLVFYFNYGSTRGAANNNRYWFSEIKLIK